MKSHIKMWPLWIVGAATLCSTLILSEAHAYKIELDFPPTALSIPQFYYEGEVEGIYSRWDQTKNQSNFSETSAVPIQGVNSSTSTQTTTSTNKTIPRNSFAFRRIPRTNPPAPVTPTPTPTTPAPTTPKPTTPTPTPPATPPVGPINPNPTPAPTPTPTPTPTPPTTNSSNLEWGAFTGWSASEISSFESLVGKPVNIVTIFAGLDNNSPFPDDFKTSVAGKNKTLLIFWEPYNSTLDQINDGSLDAYFTKYAADAKAYGGKVIIAPFHEMNGNWDPWDGPVGSNSPAKIVEAWKHMHGFFGSATNVKWGWAVNNISVPNTSTNAISAYWPGASYVDYVGLDGFNFGSPWQSFDQVFGSAISQTKGYGKPIYIMSMASAQGTNKAAWITDFGAQLAKHSEIVGWVWFNENKEKDWRVNSDAASLAAFKAILPQ